MNNTSDTCTQIIVHLRGFYDLNKINTLYISPCDGKIYLNSLTDYLGYVTGIYGTYKNNYKHLYNVNLNVIFSFLDYRDPAGIFLHLYVR